MPINKKENREMRRLVKEFNKKADAPSPDIDLPDIFVLLMGMIVNLNNRLINIERKLKP